MAIIGNRVRELREKKKFSQDDLEKRTGLPQCYISRLENGHTIPAIETLEKMASALEVPLHLLFYDGEEPSKLPNLPRRKGADELVWEASRKNTRMLSRFCRLLCRMNEEDRNILFFIAQKLAQRKAV